MKSRLVCCALLLLSSLGIPASQAASTVGLLDDLERVDAWVNSHDAPDFAGAWTDPEGHTVVAFAGDPSQHLPELREAVTQPGKLRGIQVRRSLLDLRTTSRRISQDWHVLRDAGIQVTGSGVNLEGNTLDVFVREPDDAARQVLTARYGEVSVFQGEFAKPAAGQRTGDPPPWEAGMELEGVCDGADCLLAGCTSNFNTFQMINGIRYYHMLTSGHCFIQNSTVTNGPTGPVLGTVVQRIWYDGANTDVEKFTIAFGTQAPKIITSTGTVKDVFNLRTSRSTSDFVCKSGIATNETCNWDVTHAFYDVDVCVEEDPEGNCLDIWTIYDQVRAIRSSSGVYYGDSGGPVYKAYSSSSITAHGIVFAKNGAGTEMFYTFLKDALTNVGSYLCVVGNC